MKKTIDFSAAYDKRDPDPKKDYGVHGVEVAFVLEGQEGAVHFNLFTNWHLPHVQEELDHREEKDSRFKHLFCHPQPVSIGYHSPVPRYEGQEPLMPSCVYLGGKPCFSDGSFLNADPVYRRLLTEGSEGVWAALEEYYQSIFNPSLGG